MFHFYFILKKTSTIFDDFFSFSQTGTNPFEEYDESKNPFAAEEEDDDQYDKNNPFRDECDKNSNPFYN